MLFYKLLLIFLVTSFNSCRSGTETGTLPGDDSLTSYKVLVTDNEPGEKMVVTGKIIDSKTKQPVAGAVVFAYHTDKSGIYSDKGSEHPRIKGRLITDSNGKFTIKSIVPGSYPDSRNPAHIHFEIEKEGYAKMYGELLFEGDPYITDEYRKAKGFVVGVLKPDSEGIKYCEFELSIEK